MTLQDSTPTIEILPEHIIDQIKAGEVLERPAALLKELIENSLDAGSTEIHLHLVENGMDLLSIEDNGHGMTFKNLPFAFLRHATSKIKRFEDLYRLHSFGFRGEALASLAASARVTCTTQPKNLDEEGGKIIINGGATELLIPQQSSAHGTSIYIKDLFYNTPARLKFVKSKVSEKSALKKMIYSFVLSHPQVTFTIKWDEKEKEIFKAVSVEQNAERIAQVFFSKRSESAKVIEASQDYDNYRVRVYFTKDTYTTPQYRHHYLFANKRFFQDKSLHQALLRNLEVFWRFGESGHYVVEIETPTEEIDVNVHPNKTQIKFQRADVVYSLLVASLKAGIKTQAVLPPQTLFTENSLGPSSEAPSFFSQEENRNFDLMNFSSNEASSMPSDFSLFRAESALIQAPRFQRLLQEFLIVDLAKTYLVDLKKLLATSLSEELFYFQQKEEAAGPLLISEPFHSPKGKIDSHFEELKLLGLEFDRLNAEYIVLRTIPKFLPQVLLSSLAGSLVRYFEGTKIQKFDKNTFSHFYHERIEQGLLSSVPDTFIEKYLNNENSNFMVELTSERIRTLFKS